MGTAPDSPDRIRAGIESTRKELAHDVDELADRASPRRAVERRRERMRQAVSGARERVMGSSSHGREQARERTRHTAHSVQETSADAAESVRRTAEEAGHRARGAPHEAARRTEGNPVAAGVIAFGAGMLGASLLPDSETEQRTVSRFAERTGGATGPVKAAAEEYAGRLKAGAGETARHAAEEVARSA
ncbi:DUF3618 domain-containing protein, partial [Streptomyces sp. SID5475]|nr:DUF3618 domain-containing protein [Streptomyces sp. SID5475]